MSRPKAVFRRYKWANPQKAAPVRTFLGLAAALIVTLAAVSGCGRPGPAAEEPEIVYICSETNQVIVGPPQNLPAVHPVTGQPTLLRGVYCPECRRWYAMPPPDHASGNPKPIVCRVHDVPMLLDGPIPPDSPGDSQ